MVKVVGILSPKLQVCSLPTYTSSFRIYLHVTYLCTLSDAISISISIFICIIYITNLVDICLFFCLTWGVQLILLGLDRCGKSCRLRWINYLKPDVKRGNFAQDEEDLIIKLHALLGNRYIIHLTYNHHFFSLFLSLPKESITRDGCIFVHVPWAHVSNYLENLGYHKIKLLLS